MVVLTLKNPATGAADFNVELDANKTILDLKRVVQRDYPGNPSIDLQRIIFAGRQLDDSATLSDVLKQHDINAPQTFHVVIRKSPPGSAPAAATPQPPLQPPAFPPGFAPNFAFANGPMPMPPPFFFPYGMPNAAMPGAAPFPAYPGAFGTNPWGQVPNFNPNNLPNPFVPPPPPAAAQPPQPPAAAPQAQPPQAPPARAAADNNFDGGEQPGGAEPNQNLWLFVKLALLVALLSQGADSSRVMWLSIGAFFVYLYQTGRLRMQFSVRVRRGQQPQQQPGAADGGQADPAQAQQEPRRPGVVGSYLIPFVMSIFPTYEPPEVVVPPPPAPVDPQQPPADVPAPEVDAGAH